MGFNSLNIGFGSASSGGGGGSGTVTSVGLLDGSTTPIYDISNSPVTVSGTLTYTLKTQNKNLVFASDASSNGQQPTFRSLVAADIPALPYVGTTLTSAHILVGNSSNVATDVAMSGDIAISNTGATSYSGIVPANKGGTGINNGSNTLTLGASLTINGGTVNQIPYYSGTNTISACTSVKVNNGPLSDAITSNFLSVTGTLNSTNTAADPVGVRFNITTPAMANPSLTPEMQAFQVQFTGTGVMTGAVLSIGASVGNDVSGGATAVVTAFPATGTASTGLAGDNGGFFQANAAGLASSADKIGSINRAGNGPQNFGSINIAAVNDANKNIGVVGVSNGNGSGKTVGGHFQIGTTLPTWHNAAVSADIGSSSGYVFYGSKTAGATEIFTVANNGLTTITTTGINGTCLNVIGDNKNTEIKWSNTSGTGNSYGFNASNSTASLANSFYLIDYTNANHVHLLINNSGDFMVGSAITDISGTGATAYFPVSGTILLNNPTTITGKTTLTGGTIASGANSFVLTTTMPTSMSGATSAISWTVTGAGSSSQNNRAMLFTHAAGYTGSSKCISLEIDNSNASTGNDYQWTGASTNPGGNSGLNVFVIGSTTGANTAGYYEAANGIINVGLFGKSATAKNSGTNIGVIGQANNTGTSPIHIGGYFSLAVITPTYTSAALIADNGATSSPVFLAQVAGATAFKIDNLANIIDNATGSALSIHATSGFSYLATCAGTPDGTPSVLPTGAAPYIIDTSGGKLWAYYGSAWHFVAFT